MAKPWGWLHRVGEGEELFAVSKTPRRDGMPIYAAPPSPRDKYNDCECVTRCAHLDGKVADCPRA